MTCIVCPVGCQMSVDVNDDGTVSAVEGNTCPRGKKYAVSEIQNPVRTLTTTVRVDGSDIFLPVKTAAPIPKSSMMSAMKKIKDIKVHAPIAVGDIIEQNITDNINLIACANIG